jgi:radical SAM superfamily enzyme YgiQ (UPF0313 family)
VRSFRFVDDNFTYNQARVSDICQGIIDRGMRIVWTCCSRADLAASFNPGVLRLMRRSGCRRICIGFESGSEEILESVGRGISLSDMELTLREIRRAGISIHADFIIGMPGETRASLSSTFDLVRRVGEGARATLSLARFRPYPGTVAADASGEGPFAAGREGMLLSDEEIDRWFERAGRYVENHNIRLLARDPTYVMGRLWESIRSPGEMAGLAAKVVRSYLGRGRLGGLTRQAGSCCREGRGDGAPHSVK